MSFPHYHPNGWDPKLVLQALIINPVWIRHAKVELETGKEPSEVDSTHRTALKQVPCCSSCFALLGHLVLKESRATQTQHKLPWQFWTEHLRASLLPCQRNVEALHMDLLKVGGCCREPKARMGNHLNMMLMNSPRYLCVFVLLSQFLVDLPDEEWHDE